MSNQIFPQDYFQTVGFRETFILALWLSFLIWNVALALKHLMGAGEAHLIDLLIDDLG